jgi:two-component system, NarL family, nitrate/nitrite response regulator NarL
VSRSRLRVTVVDDHSLFAESLAIALRTRDIEACTVAPNPSWTTLSQLEHAIVDTQPHLVLLDLDLGIPGDGMRLLSILSAAGTTVVIVTGSADRVHQGEALARGACAVIEKSASFTDIVATVQRAQNRLPVMPRGRRDELVGAYREATESHRELCRRFESMTRREAEVLGQLMAGKRVAEIARGWVVSESTVRTQVKAVLAKLEVSSQLTAVGLAHQIGWHPQVSDDPAVALSATPARSRSQVPTGSEPRSATATRGATSS